MTVVLCKRCFLYLKQLCWWDGAKRWNHPRRSQSAWGSWLRYTRSQTIAQHSHTTEWWRMGNTYREEEGGAKTTGAKNTHSRSRTTLYDDAWGNPQQGQDRTQPPRIPHLPAALTMIKYSNPN